MKAYDLVGRTFNSLKVIKRLGAKKPSKLVYWLCKCDCENTTEVATADLMRNHTTSCGCMKHVFCDEDRVKHGCRHTKLYGIWTGMKQRCNNPKNERYKNYGGRGIQVCEEWAGSNSFEAFRDWAADNGYEEELTLERIDVDGNYSPDNCSWIPFKEQCLNKQDTVRYKGKPLKTYLESIGRSNDHKVILGRIYAQKMTIEDAINKPIKRR